MSSFLQLFCILLVGVCPGARPLVAAAPGPELTIHAQDKMTLDDQRHEAWATGRPEAFHGSWHLSGGRLRAALDPQTRQVVRIDVLDGLHIESQKDGQSLEGQEGWYNVPDHTAWSSGPRVVLKDPSATLVTRGEIHVHDTPSREGKATGPSRLTETGDENRIWGEHVMVHLQQAGKGLQHADVQGHVLAVNTPLEGLVTSAQGDAAHVDGPQNQVDVSGPVSCQQGAHYLTGDRARIDRTARTLTVWRDDGTPCGGLFHPSAPDKKDTP